MAITFAQEDHHNFTYSTSSGVIVVFNLTSATPGSFFVLFVTYTPSGQTITGVSDGTNTYHALGIPLDRGDGYTMAAYYAVNSFSGTISPSVTFSGPVGFPAGQCLEFTGASASPFDAVTSTTGISGSPISTSVASVGANELLIGLPCPNGFTSGPSSGWTGTVQQGAIYAVETAAGTYSPSITIGSPLGTAAMIAASFKPFGAAGAVAPIICIMQ